ncbi:MAG: hypothetical protein V7K97_14220 [Nostoc sp.]|uniref:RNA polymerase factor sigma-54 n=1 Tax=Nostoc sp. TaxID=1180 RepID=UPI002FF91E45
MNHVKFNFFFRNAFRNANNSLSNTAAVGAKLLKLRFGIAIARRTVVKYRQLAGIDSSHIRKLSKSKNS